MNIVAIECATPSNLVAVACGDARCGRVITPSAGAPNPILPATLELLTQTGCSLAALDYLAVGAGPGGFTGLRVAAAAIAGLSFSLNKPVLKLSSLQVLAQTAQLVLGVTSALVAIDARQQEIYWGKFCLQAGIMQAVGIEQVTSPQALPQRLESDMMVGSGVGAHHTWLQQHRPDWPLESSLSHPSWQGLLDLAARSIGKLLSHRAADIYPTYLRNQVTQPAK